MLAFSGAFATGAEAAAQEDDCCDHSNDHATRRAALQATWLMRFPNTAMGIALGLGANALLWQQLATTPLLGSPSAALSELMSNFAETSHASSLHRLFWVSGVAVWCAVLLTLLAKAVRYPSLVAFEFRHRVRVYFFFAPHVGALMLALSCPEEWLVGHEAARQRVWLAALLLQLFLFQRILSRWMFSTDGHLEQARAPYLLSTVGWFLLCVLGTHLGLSEEWGLELPVLCLGAGCFFYTLVCISILQVASIAFSALLRSSHSYTPVCISLLRRRRTSPRRPRTTRDSPRSS